MSTRRLRLLQVFSQYAERGGEEDSVERIAAGLAPNAEVRQCFFVNRQWLGSSAPNKLKQAVWMWSNPASLQQLRQAHAEFKPDAWIAHNVFPVGSAAVYREATRLRVPVIRYLHNYRPFSINGYLWAGDRLVTGSLLQRYLTEIRHGAWQQSRTRTAYFGAVLLGSRRLGWWKSVQAWVAISDFVREKFIDFGLPPERVFTVRHFWRPKCDEVPRNAGRHYLFLGRLIEAKGLSVLFQTWSNLERLLGSNCPPLVIAGAGPLENEVRKKAADLRSVTFAGRLSGAEKHAALLDARAVVVPSLWWEPLGLVVYEAYDYGKPVLAAASGGLTETVVHGQTGLLHQAGDAEQLTRDVQQLEADEAARVAMGLAARAWLIANAGEQEWRTKLLQVINWSIERAAEDFQAARRGGE